MAGAVEGELDVLWLPVVALEPDAGLGHGTHLRVRERARLAEGLGQWFALESAAGLIVEDESLFLRRQFGPDGEVALGDRVVVRVESRAHQALTGTVQRADDHLVHVPRDGVGGEHHAARARVNHLLDDHRDRDPLERQSLLLPVGQSPLVVGGGPYPPDGVEKLDPPANEQEAVVQSRERLAGGVLTDG